MAIEIYKNEFEVEGKLIVPLLHSYSNLKFDFFSFSERPVYPSDPNRVILIFCSTPPPWVNIATPLSLLRDPFSYNGGIINHGYLLFSLFKTVIVYI